MPVPAGAGLPRKNEPIRSLNEVLVPDVVVFSAEVALDAPDGPPTDVQPLNATVPARTRTSAARVNRPPSSMHAKPRIPLPVSPHAVAPQRVPL
jgi:hypothetical protein